MSDIRPPDETCYLEGCETPPTHTNRDQLDEYPICEDHYRLLIPGHSRRYWKKLEASGVED